jgi:hypothetical protein
MWENVTARKATVDNITWRVRFSCWMNKSAYTHTNTHSVYVVLIAFARQVWLRERALVLRSNVHCLSCNIVFVVSLIIEAGIHFGTTTTAVATMGWLPIFASYTVPSYVLLRHQEKQSKKLK